MGAPDTSSDRPYASVIIPHLDDPRRLARCLRALHAGGAEAMAGIEVIVVDNGSRRLLGLVLKPFPDVRVVYEPKRGAAHARNRGVAVSRAPRLWFLDADTVPAPDWPCQARRHAARAAIVAGRVTVFDERPPPRTGAEAFEAVFAFDCAAYVRKGFSVTANLLTTRVVFDHVGPFHDGVAEDKDWCARARARGASIAYAPDLAVAHPSRADWEALQRKWKRLSREHWSSYRDRRGGRLLWGLRAGAVAASGLAHVPRVIASDRLGGAGDRARGAATLLAIRTRRALWMMQQVAGREV